MILSRETCYIDNTALVGSQVVLGKNLFIGPYVNAYEGSIGNDTKIGAYTEIGGAIIGARCKIQARVFIPHGVTIEDDVFIGPAVVFTNDKYPRAFGSWEVKTTLIKRGAAIGAGAVIAPGVTIGEGALVGAGSVVIHDVAPLMCALGNPAKIVGFIPDLTKVQDFLGVGR
jgi:UDP-2-acetamido-3-amino-2,3-dideoxy-glucuronate N-acetyltransferase